jgi:hypothetical protein
MTSGGGRRYVARYTAPLDGREAERALRGASTGGLSGGIAEGITYRATV